MNRILLACIALALPQIAIASEWTPAVNTRVGWVIPGQQVWDTPQECVAQAVSILCAESGDPTWWVCPALSPCQLAENQWGNWSIADGLGAAGCKLGRCGPKMEMRCPTGGWVYQGGGWCSRPTCLSWQVRQSDGSCGNPSCGGCAVFNTTTHLCDNTCFLPSRCMPVEGASQCLTPDGVCRLL